MTTYIHYGSDHYDSRLFMPIQNGRWQPKPAVKTGLWGSRENDENGWRAWCEENAFQVERLNRSFRFQLPGAHILTLSSPDQLPALPKLHPWEPHNELNLEILPHASAESLASWYIPNWCYLDFEKLAESYDAIEMENYWAFKDSFPTWDCNCILVLKADCICEIPSR